MDTPSFYIHVSASMDYRLSCKCNNCGKYVLICHDAPVKKVKEDCDYRLRDIGLSRAEQQRLQQREVEQKLCHEIENDVMEYASKINHDVMWARPENVGRIRISETEICPKCGKVFSWCLDDIESSRIQKAEDSSNSIGCTFGMILMIAFFIAWRRTDAIWGLIVTILIPFIWLALMKVRDRTSPKVKRKEEIRKARQKMRETIDDPQTLPIVACANNIEHLKTCFGSDDPRIALLLKQPYKGAYVIDSKVK